MLSIYHWIIEFLFKISWWWKFQILIKMSLMLCFIVCGYFVHRERIFLTDNRKNKMTNLIVHTLIFFFKTGI